MEQLRRKSALSVIAIALVVGISGFMTVAGRPRFATYRTVDVLELVASGICFGVALAGILRAWRTRHEPGA